MRPFTKIENQPKITALYTAFSVKRGVDYSFGGEFHDFWEIVICVTGKFGVTAGGKTFTISPGEAIIHPPMEFHNLNTEGNNGGRIIVFTFAAEMMPKNCGSVLKLNNLKLAKEILSDIKNAFEFSGISVTGIKQHSELSASVAIKKLELLLLNTILKNSGMKTEPQNKMRRAEIFENAVRFLNQNTDKTLTVSEISKALYMSEINLQKIFKKYAGVGVMHFFTQLKMTEATILIKSGIPVGKVASALGFPNQNYFSTVFKRMYGMPPSRLKKTSNE
ncbi:MAG: AraC family transcriptional regulator [Oscillospiraceae bacterium]|nr:AraC family transcriptional regulator [Oscillospiraceae bacterium]